MSIERKAFTPGRKLVTMAVLSSIVLPLGTAHAQAQEVPNACGPLTSAYGPFDYRTSRGKLKIVEDYHFTPAVEALIRGSSGSLGGDLSYLMATSPNHLRGLIAVMRLGEKTNSEQPEGLKYPIECYFERALRFRPDDATVRIVYAQYLRKHARTDEAVRQLRAAETIGKDDAFTQYNIGLAYFELKKFGPALRQADKAKEMGFGRTELADMLKRAQK